MSRAHIQAMFPPLTHDEDCYHHYYYAYGGPPPVPQSLPPPAPPAFFTAMEEARSGSIDSSTGAASMDSAGGATATASSTGTGTSTSTLRSCTTCSKAKAKCVRQPGQDMCERCARLGKECHSREPTIRRKKHIKTTRAAQLEKLENKIEHLVNALSIAQAQRDVPAPHGQPSPPASERSSHGATTNDTGTAMCYEDAEDDGPASGSLSATTSPAVRAPGSNWTSEPSSSSTTEQPALGVSLHEAGVLLDRFRRLMAPSFPFVIISRNETAASLQADKPLLLHAIILVASFHDLTTQQHMLKQFMRDVSERTLINGEKRLDIVQGILIVAGWYHPYLFMTQQLTNLLHMARAVISDLGLDRPAIDCNVESSAAFKAIKGSFPAHRVESLDEFRALAGIWYINSMIASCFHKMEAPPFTKYLSDTVDHLEKVREHKSDSLLVHLVRLQHLQQEAYTSDATQANQQMYIKSFTAEHERLRTTNVAARDEENLLVRLQNGLTSIMILEICLNDLSSEQPSNASSLRLQLDTLCDLITTIKSYTDLFLRIPVEKYLTMPFFVLGQFAHCFILLTRIVSLEIDGLDNSELQQRLAFYNVVEAVCSRFEQSAHTSIDGLPVNNPCFSHWAARARWMKSMYENKFGPPGSKPAQQKALAALPWPPQGAAVGSGASPPAPHMMGSPRLQETQSQRLKRPDAPHPGLGPEWVAEQDEMAASFERALQKDQQSPQQAQQQNACQPQQSQTQTSQEQEQLQQQHFQRQQQQQQQQQIQQMQLQMQLQMQQQMQQPSTMLPDDVMSGDFFQYLDDNFWQNFAGDFNAFGGTADVMMSQQQ